MMTTAIWIPPSLCGCELRLTADFLDGSVINGISYRHPKPFSITDIEIVNICSGHQKQSLSMPDTSVLMEIDKYTGQPFQQRGYLQHPIANPSPAQCLYEFLSRFGGQTHGYPCGCSAHQFVDRTQNPSAITYLLHPLHTKKCLKHKNDTIDMQQAALDFQAAQAAEVAG